GDARQVHKLHQVLMKSRSARVLAVRRGAQDTPGKKKAGGDGKAPPPPPRTAGAGRRDFPPLTHKTPDKNRTPRADVPTPPDGKAPAGYSHPVRKGLPGFGKASPGTREARFEANRYGFIPLLSRRVH